MLIFGYATLGLGVCAIIVGLYIGKLSGCPHGAEYCLLDPLWLRYRYTVLGGFLALLGIIFVGKGYEVQTPW